MSSTDINNIVTSKNDLTVNPVNQETPQTLLSEIDFSFSSVELSQEEQDLAVQYFRYHPNKIPPEMLSSIGEFFLIQAANQSSISSLTEFNSYVRENPQMMKFLEVYIDTIGMTQGRRWVQDVDIVEVISEVKDFEFNRRQKGLIQRLYEATINKEGKLSELSREVEGLVSRRVTLLNEVKKIELEAEAKKQELIISHQEQHSRILEENREMTEDFIKRQDGYLKKLEELDRVLALKREEVCKQIENLKLEHSNLLEKITEERFLEQEKARKEKEKYQKEIGELKNKVKALEARENDSLHKSGNYLIERERRVKEILEKGKLSINLTLKEYGEIKISNRLDRGEAQITKDSSIQNLVNQIYDHLENLEQYSKGDAMELCNYIIGLNNNSKFDNFFSVPMALGSSFKDYRKYINYVFDSFNEAKTIFGSKEGYSIWVFEKLIKNPKINFLTYKKSKDSSANRFSQNLDSDVFQTNMFKVNLGNLKKLASNPDRVTSILKSSIDYNKSGVNKFSQLFEMLKTEINGFEEQSLIFCNSSKEMKDYAAIEHKYFHEASSLVVVLLCCLTVHKAKEIDEFLFLDDEEDNEFDFYESLEFDSADSGISLDFNERDILLELSEESRVSKSIESTKEKINSIEDKLGSSYTKILLTLLNDGIDTKDFNIKLGKNGKIIISNLRGSPYGFSVLASVETKTQPISSAVSAAEEILRGVWIE